MLFLKYSHGGAHFSLAFDMGGVHLAGERDEENLAGEGFRSFLFGSLTSLRFFQFPICCYQLFLPEDWRQNPQGHTNPALSQLPRAGFARRAGRQHSAQWDSTVPRRQGLLSTPTPGTSGFWAPVPACQRCL